MALSENHQPVLVLVEAVEADPARTRSALDKGTQRKNRPAGLRMRTLHPALRIIQSRASMATGMSVRSKIEAEGGCGVIGAACSEQIPGRHLLPALAQMRNRGNGKGGGIAALGLSADHLGVSKTILQRDYLVQIAYLQPSVRTEVENEFIFRYLDVDSTGLVETVADYQSIDRLVVKPPEGRR